MANKPKNHITKPVPDSNKDSNQVALVRQQYSGPLPPPSVLEQFDRVCPGSAKIIIDNFIAQSEHRRTLEKTVIQSGSRDSLLGIISAFILGMTTVIGAIICILNNKENVGLSLGAIGLSSLVGTFIYGTRQRRQERESKTKLIQPENLQKK